MPAAALRPVRLGRRRMRVLDGQLDLPFPAPTRKRSLRLVTEPMWVRYPDVEECRHATRWGEQAQCQHWECRHSLILDQLEATQATLREALGPCRGGEWRRADWWRQWPDELRAELLTAMAEGGMPTCALDVAASSDGEGVGLATIGALMARSSENARKWVEAALAKMRDIVADEDA